MNKAFNLFFLREMEYFHKIIQSTNERREKSRAKTRVFHLFLFHFLHFTLGFRFHEQRMNVYCRLCFPRRLWWCKDVRSNKHRVQAWAWVWIEYCEMRNIGMQEMVEKGWDQTAFLIFWISRYLFIYLDRCQRHSDSMTVQRRWIALSSIDLIPATFVSLWWWSQGLTGRSWVDGFPAPAQTLVCRARASGFYPSDE